MAKIRIILFSLQFIGDNLFHFDFDAVVVLLNHLLHSVYAVLIYKVGDNRDFPVSLCFSRYALVIYHDLTVENLLLYPFIEVIRYRSDKHTLCQIGDFGRCDLLPLFGQLKCRKFGVFDIFKLCFFRRHSLQRAMRAVGVIISTKGLYFSPGIRQR